jgi:hypothetical protein
MAITAHEAPAPHEPDNRDRQEQPKKRGWKFWTAMGAVPTAAVAAGALVIANNGEDKVATDKPAATSTPNPGEASPSVTPSAEAPSPSPTDLPSVTPTTEVPNTGAGDFDPSAYLDASYAEMADSLTGAEKAAVATILTKQIAPDSFLADGDTFDDIQAAGRDQSPKDDIETILHGINGQTGMAFIDEDKEADKAQLLIDANFAELPSGVQSAKDQFLEYYTHNAETSSAALYQITDVAFFRPAKGAKAVEATCSLKAGNDHSPCKVIDVNFPTGKKAGTISVVYTHTNQEQTEGRWQILELATDADSFDFTMIPR